MYGSLFVSFFFFQAEDGIRDYKVTGVQTCALPISQDMRFHSLEPGARYSGYFRRCGLWTKSSSEAPLGHSVPRLTGWSGSPSTWITDSLAFLAPSLSEYISMPQPTEQ